MAAPAETHGPPKPLVVFPVSAMAQVAAVVAASFSYLRHRPVPALLLAATGIPTQCRIPTVPLPVRPAWLLLPTSSPKLPARNPAPTVPPPILPSPIPPFHPWSCPEAQSPTRRSSATAVPSMPSMLYLLRPFRRIRRSSLSRRPLAGPAIPLRTSIRPVSSPARIQMWRAVSAAPALSPSSSQLAAQLASVVRKSWMLPTSPPAHKTPTLPTTLPLPSLLSASQVLPIWPSPTFSPILPFPLSSLARPPLSRPSSPIKVHPLPPMRSSPRPFLPAPLSNPSPALPAGAPTPHLARKAALRARLVAWTPLLLPPVRPAPRSPLS